VLSVVKGRWIWHGLIPAARCSGELRRFVPGVSTWKKAWRWRGAGLKTPVLVLGNTVPFSNFPVLFKKKLIPTIASAETADALNALADAGKQRLHGALEGRQWIGRIGVSAQNALKFTACSGLPGVGSAGLYTHFSSSDVDPEYTRASGGVSRGGSGSDRRGNLPTFDS